MSNKNKKVLILLITSLIISAGVLGANKVKADTSITVISPNGGENIEIGKTYRIRWNTTISNDQYYISLLKNGSNYSQVMGGYSYASGDCYFDWSVPTGTVISPGSDYKIKIYNASGTVQDTSDTNFSLFSNLPAVTVVTPNGGENIVKGQNYTINWNVNWRPTGINNYTVNIYYRQTTGSNQLNQMIATGISNQDAASGYYNWSLPNALTDGSYKIVITANGYGTNLSDESDASFNIISSVAGSISVIAPRGGSSYKVGDTVSIQWTMSGDVGPAGPVTVWLYKGDVPVATLKGADVSTTNQWNWVIYSNLGQAGSNYKIRVISADYLSIYGESGNFTITPYIKITSPDGGESLEIGKAYTIKFNTNVSNDQYWIDLFKGGTGHMQVVTGNFYASGDNTFQWTIPKGVLMPGSDYQIRVINKDQTAQDLSDNYFSITGPAVRITFPNGGESIIKGQQLGIYWDVNWKPDEWQAVRKVNIYYRKSGGMNQLIAEGVNSQNISYGHYIWTVPSTLEDGVYKIIVTSQGYGTNLSDESDANFNIITSSGTSSITVTSPNGGEQWVVGSAYNITWTTQNITTGSGYGVNLLKSDGSLYSQLVVDSRTTSFTWTIPSTIPVGQYKIEVYHPRAGVDTSASNYKKAADVSDNYFTIAASTPKISASVSGPTSVEVNKVYTYTFTTQSNTQDSYLIYKVNWGDNSVTQDSGSNGGSKTFTHSWTSSGIYTITFTATSPSNASVYNIGTLAVKVSATTEPPADQCFPDDTLIKLPDDSKVYVIRDCKKEWIETAEEFKQEGYKWEDVKEVNSSVIQAYSDYLQATANLLRAIGQQKVYRVINDKILWVPTIAAFNTQGLKWEDIQNVNESTINQYSRLKLVRVKGDPKVYYLTESGLKRWIPTAEIFNSYNNKWEDVAELESKDVNGYVDNALIKLENELKVYKLENGKKRWIKTIEAFNRLGLDWNKIAPVNRAEFDYYPEGVVIE
jgi:hypothetical protein